MTLRLPVACLESRDGQQKMSTRRWKAVVRNHSDPYAARCHGESGGGENGEGEEEKREEGGNGSAFIKTIHEKGGGGAGERMAGFTENSACNSSKKVMLKTL